MPYLTDERLKSYLDTNQLHREQLALAVLSLDKRFTEVRPRHPRGGPDGGRDIEAIFRGDQRVFGAVGFVNQADDSEDRKKDVRKKYRDDLTSALSAKPPPTVFVFLTNVNLTVGDKDDLVAIAKKNGLVHSEIFDRERLRIALDSADGFAIRFQYLGVPLSEEEQAIFFAKWGDDINSVITTGFQSIQWTLDHLLFLQESTGPLSSFQLSFELDKAYPAEEIGHFRAFSSVYLREPKLKILSLLFGSTDKSDRLTEPRPADATETHAGIKFGISGAQWEQYFDPPSSNNPATPEALGSDPPEKYVCVGSSQSVGVSTVQFLSIKYYKGSFLRFEPVLCLQDFDDCMIMPILNRSLALRVKAIHVISSGYKLLEVSADAFEIDETTFEQLVPIEFSDEELADPWTRLRPKDSSVFQLSFFDEIPLRMSSSRRTKNTIPARK